MRRVRALVFVGGALLLVVACATREDSHAPEVKVDPDRGTYEVFTSPAEARALRFVTSEGRTVTLFAEKDEVGDVKRITSLFVQDAAQLATGNGTLLELGRSDARPARVVGPDGAVIRVAWRTRTSGSISAVTDDGSAQATTFFGDPPAPSSRAEEDDDDDDDKAEGAWTTTRTLESCATGASPSFPSKHVFRELTDTQIALKVKRCNAPAMPGEVESAGVVIETAEPPLAYPATARDGGCVVGVPVPRAAPSSEVRPTTSEIQRLCTSLGPATIRTCKDEHYRRRLAPSLCNSLDPALDAIGVDAKRFILESCNTALASLVHYCGGAAKTAPTAICSRLRGAHTDALGGHSLVARARATIAGAGTRESAGTLDLATARSEPVPIEIDFGTETKVLPIETDPPHPVPNQPYTLKVRVLCAVGKNVRIPVTSSEPASVPYRTEGNYTVTLPSEVLTLKVRGASKPGVTHRIWVVVDGVQESYDRFTF